jgi:hypothetical protein
MACRRIIDAIFQAASLRPASAQISQTAKAVSSGIPLT